MAQWWLTPCTLLHDGLVARMAAGQAWPRFDSTQATPALALKGLTVVLDSDCFLADRLASLLFG